MLRCRCRSWLCSFYSRPSYRAPAGISCLESFYSCHSKISQKSVLCLPGMVRLNNARLTLYSLKFLSKDFIISQHRLGQTHLLISDACVVLFGSITRDRNIFREYALTVVSRMRTSRFLFPHFPTFSWPFPFLFHSHSDFLLFWYQNFGTTGKKKSKALHSNLGITLSGKHSLRMRVNFHYSVTRVVHWVHPCQETSNKINRILLCHRMIWGINEDNFIFMCGKA